MLPSINLNCNFNIQEVPYRLPSRCQTDGGITRPLGSSRCSQITCCPSPTSRALTSYDFNTKRNDESTIEVSKMTRIIPVISSHSEEMENKGSQFRAANRHLTDIYNSRLTDVKQLLNNSQKLLWIDELRQWIVEERSFIEFMQLSKKATLFDNEIPQVNISNIKSQEKIELCDRFLKHLHTSKKADRNEIIKTVVMDVQRSIKPQLNKVHHKQTATSSAILNKLPRQMEITEDKPLISKSEASLKSNLSIISSNYDKDQDILTTKNGNSGFDEFNQVKEFVENISPANNEEFRNNIYVNNCNNVPNEEITSLEIDTKIANISIGVSSSQTIPETEKRYSVAEKSVDVIINETETSNTEKTLTESENLEYNNHRTKEKFKELPRRQSLSIKRKPTIKHRVMFNFTAKLELEENKKSDHKIQSSESTDQNGLLIETNDVTERMSPELPDFPETTVDKEDVVKPVEEIEVKRDIMAPLLAKQKKRWGKRQLDKSYADDLEKDRLAELRKLKLRKKLQIVIDKTRQKTPYAIPEGPRFETYGFLAKYCIFKTANIDLYRNTFNVCDEGKKLWLTGDELMMALKGVNPNLKDYDMAHMNMVLKTIDYDMKKGADFKLFSVLAALSVKISALDSWIKAYISNSDFKQMQKKIQYCRKLWECIVDPMTNTISVHSMCIELKAGGVTESHIREVHQRLVKMGELNLIDFLTYIPLFIVIHKAIIDNPLDMTQKI